MIHAQKEPLEKKLVTHLLYVKDYSQNLLPGYTVRLLLKMPTLLTTGLLSKVASVNHSCQDAGTQLQVGEGSHPVILARMIMSK